MPNNSRKLFSALRDTASEAADSAAALVDVALSAAIDEGALDNLPIVSLGVSLLNVRDSFAAARLKRNVSEFYNAARSADKERIKDCFERIEKEPEHYEDFIETALSILLESHRPLKSQLLGRLLVSLSESRISYEQYDELTLIIAEGSVAALRAIPRYFERRYAKIINDPLPRGRPLTPHLVSLGLMDLNSMPQEINELAVLIYLHGFNGNTHVAETVKENRITGVDVPSADNHL